MSQGGTYSQYDEDVWIARLVESLPGIPQSFLEIGAGDGSENNTRNLFEQGWKGFWIDADEQNIRRAEEINPYVDWCKVRRDWFPTPKYFERQFFLYENGLGVLSIDVDGNDYHFWKWMIEAGWKPWIVVVEAQIQKPYEEPFVMPYDPDWHWPDDPATETYDWGASVYSLRALGEEMGYRFLGMPDNPHSPNMIFVRADLDLL